MNKKESDLSKSSPRIFEYEVQSATERSRDMFFLLRLLVLIFMAIAFVTSISLDMPINIKIFIFGALTINCLIFIKLLRNAVGRLEKKAMEAAESYCRERMDHTDLKQRLESIQATQ